jgi:hypothetical protein
MWLCTPPGVVAAAAALLLTGCGLTHGIDDEHVVGKASPSEEAVDLFGTDRQQHENTLVHTPVPPVLVPRYTATHPNYQKPVGGLPMLPSAEHVVIFRVTPGTGTYNHGAQIERKDGSFHVMWNNSP